MRMPFGHLLAISSNQTCHPERSEGSDGSPRLPRPTSPTPPAGCLDGLRGVRLCNGLLNALRQIWVPRPCGIGSILKLTLFQNEPATFLLTLLYLHAIILHGCHAPARPQLLAAGFALLRIPSVSFMPFARPHLTRHFPLSLLYSALTRSASDCPKIVQITPLESALTETGLLTPLDSALTKKGRGYHGGGATATKFSRGQRKTKRTKTEPVSPLESISRKGDGRAVRLRSRCIADSARPVAGNFSPSLASHPRTQKALHCPSCRDPNNEENLND